MVDCFPVTRGILIVIAVLIIFSGLSSCAREQPLTYVSLGDSLAVGIGSSDPLKLGYAPLYRDYLARKTGRDVSLIQLGVSGETSSSFIGDYRNNPHGDSQLSQAVQALKDHPGAIVTLSIGANDLLQLSNSTHAERLAGLSRFKENLDYILKELLAASDPKPQIILLAYYNPAPGSFTDLWTGRLNAVIRQVAARYGVSVAAGDRAFDGPVSTYTHYPPNVHPTDKGYQKLAKAFEAASPR